MNTIYGTKHRAHITDFFQRCASCGKLFYFSHDFNRKTVVCPYCGRRH